MRVNPSQQQILAKNYVFLHLQDEAQVFLAKLCLESSGPGQYEELVARILCLFPGGCQQCVCGAGGSDGGGGLCNAR